MFNLLFPYRLGDDLGDVEQVKAPISWIKFTAWNGVITKTVLISVAVYTLVKVHNNQSFRFLKVLVWLIIMNSGVSLLASMKFSPILLD